MFYTRSYHSCVIIDVNNNNWLYVIGGIGGSNSIEKYDINNNIFNKNWINLNIQVSSVDFIGKGILV